MTSDTTPSGEQTVTGDATIADATTAEGTLDVSDLDRYMGVPMRPGELKEPVAVNDIRRWVQAMHYPNPLHYDERWAAEGRWSEIVAPQSFTVACDTSHGASPAQVGRIPGSHLIFGGDEWWFFGPRVRPGDKLVCHRMPYDYKVADTRFAGPTCFQRGDTLYINQRGERVALQRSTAIRYRVQGARDKDMFGRAAGTGDSADGFDVPTDASNGAVGDAEPEWTDEQLAELEQRKLAFIDQVQTLGHGKRLFSSVSAGDRLAEHVIGPHSLASFATEWRAYPMTTWGATAKGPTTVRAEELGYTKEMAGFEGDRRMERVNPELTDGAYYGPSRGHLQPRWARHVGMPRGYGYGASMGAWILDYVAAWAGEWGMITHSNAQYRSPALTGDATFLSGEVVDTRVERGRVHLAVVEVDMRNQDGARLATATVEVELPAAP
jgi:N-terminal half of MaoC dehydratase